MLASLEEEVIPLYEPGSAERMAAYSPTGKVPVLIIGDMVIWNRSRSSITLPESVSQDAAPGPPIRRLAPMPALFPRDACGFPVAAQALPDEYAPREPQARTGRRGGRERAPYRAADGQNVADVSALTERFCSVLLVAARTPARAHHLLRFCQLFHRARCRRRRLWRR